MLILTRKVDQGVRLYDTDGRYIGHVVVLGVERDRVKLGVDSDPRFVVLRDELVEDAPPYLMKAPPAVSSETVVSNGRTSARAE